MLQLSLPYGKETVSISFPRDQVKAVLTPQHLSDEGMTQQELVLQALRRPIGSPTAAELAQTAQQIVVITSDHTRPVPSRITMPLLLSELRRGNPHAEITILIATGAHRAPTEAELIDKLGEEIAQNERIVCHNAFDTEQMVSLGTLPSGKECRVNRLVSQADLVVAEGFIEPHFFAGFSGGRKSILPGVAWERTIMSNHCAAFIDHPCARTGVLEENPIHLDMAAAADLAKLAFVLNVVIDAKKQVIAAFAGSHREAHLEGCRFVTAHAGVDAVPADIVITTNGGYPLDQNIYQSVKSMTAAESCVRPGGVIIEIARCADGNGGDRFIQWFAETGSAAATMEKIRSIAAEDTIADQWQAQILARVLLKATVLMVADEKNREDIEALGITYCATLEEALQRAQEICPNHDGYVVIPDGVSVIVRE